MANYFDPFIEGILYQTIPGTMANDAATHAIFGVNSNRVAVTICNPTPNGLFITWSPSFGVTNPQLILRQGSSAVYTWEDYGVLITYAWFATLQITPEPQNIGDPLQVMWTEIIYKPKGS
jgi:hypothetical protein